MILGLLTSTLNTFFSKYIDIDLLTVQYTTVY